MVNDIIALGALIVAVGVIGEGMRRMLGAVLAMKGASVRASDTMAAMAKGIADLAASKEREHMRLERALERLEARQDRHETWHGQH